MSVTSRCADLARLHPDFRASLEAVLSDLRAEGFAPLVWETARSPERAAYLQGIGASPRGVASRHVPRDGWAHAADVIDGRASNDGRLVGWGSSVAGTPRELVAARAELAQEFFRALGRAAHAHGLVWGGDWRRLRDMAHLEAP